VRYYDTSALVKQYLQEAGSKLARAQKLGTAIVDETGFDALVRERSA